MLEIQTLRSKNFGLGTAKTQDLCFVTAYGGDLILT